MFKTKKEIKDWLVDHDVESYTINKDLTVDVNGSVNLFQQNLVSIPVQFNKVNGDFFCCYNKLTNLIGCPNYVSGHFLCHINELKNLKGCPKYVGGDFDCSNNAIDSLEFCPEEVKGEFICDDNEIFDIIFGDSLDSSDFYTVYEEHKRLTAKKELLKLEDRFGDIDSKKKKKL